MKRIITIMIAVMLFFVSSCAETIENAPTKNDKCESSTGDAVQTELNNTSDKKTVSASCFPSASCSTSPDDSPSSFEQTIVNDHKEVLSKIYDEFPFMVPLPHTVDYISEYIKRSSKDYGEDITEKHIEKYTPKTFWIDPFSEQLLPEGTENEIAKDTLYGEILDRYNFPNYRAYWSKNPYDATQSDLEMHSFWFLENGDLLRVICDGRLEYNHYIAPGTSWESLDLRNYYYNFTVRECTVLTLQDFLNLKEHYVSILQVQFDISERMNPHKLGVWPWEDWPEIFVEKYGLE